VGDPADIVGSSDAGRTAAIPMEVEAVRSIRWNRSIALGCSACFVVLLAGSVLRTHGAPRLEPYEGLAAAIGTGEAYTALASGPGAVLWNPAGILGPPGIHTVLATSLGPGDESSFVGGATIGTEGIAVAWTTSSAGSPSRITGSVAGRALPGLQVGASLAFATGAADLGLSGDVGLRYASTTWRIAAAAFGLLSESSLRLCIGGSLHTLPGLTLALDLRLEESGSEIALGGEATIWILTVRWGVAIGITGGFNHLGIGIGFDFLGMPVDLGAGFLGADLDPLIAGSLTLRFPAWW